MAENPMIGMRGDDASNPALKSFAITPNDSADLPVFTRYIWVGGAGALKVTLVGDDGDHTGVVMSAVPAGTMLKIAARRVYATGTAATLLIGFA